MAVLAVAVVLAWAGEASAASWTTFGFDVQRTGFNPVERSLSPAALGERWVTAVAGQINTQPLVAGGRVYVGTEAGWLVALDAGTGAVVSRRFVATAKPGPKYGCPTCR